MGEITSFLLGNSFNVKGPCPICFSYPEVVKNFVNSYLVKIYGRGGVRVGATEPESYNTSAASPSSRTTLLNCSILLPYCKRLQSGHTLLFTPNRHILLPLGWSFYCPRPHSYTPVFHHNCQEGEGLPFRTDRISCESSLKHLPTGRQESDKPLSATILLCARAELCEH